MTLQQRTWRVKSATSKKGTTYVVTEYVNGSWSCGCPAWTMNRNRPDCKHILQIKLAILQRDSSITDALAEYKENGSVSEATKRSYKEAGGDGYTGNRKENNNTNPPISSKRILRKIVI